MPLDIRLLQRSRWKRYLYRAFPSQTPLMTIHLAAIDIQRWVRGFLIRRRYLHPTTTTTTTTTIVKASRRPRLGISLVAAYLQDVGAIDLGTDHVPSYINWIAIRIQRWWRRQRYQRLRFVIFNIAAVVIQRWWRRRRRQQPLPSLSWRSEPFAITDDQIFFTGQIDRSFAGQWQSAIRIQRWFRSRIHRKVFLFYRDLIRSKQDDDPRLILRAINPIESALLDAAAGLHIRLRLGGDQFPPTIYYKIFTHSPISDIGAFAPRPYQIEFDLKRKRRRSRADPSSSIIQPGSDHSRWYHRRENNDWRAIHESIVKEKWIVTHGADSKSSPGGAGFHYLRGRRRADLIRRRKLRKLQWLRKMYGLTTTTTAPDPTPTISVDQDAGLGLQHLMKALEDVDDDDQRWTSRYLQELETEAAALLDWSLNLDFDAYRSAWASMATTAPILPPWPYLSSSSP